MPTKRNRKDSESSNCSTGLPGIPDDTNNQDPSLTNGSEQGSDDVEVAWMRPCCTPLGCLIGGQVNLTEPNEIEKIVCSNEACSSGPYMHKECFTRWEDGLLTYLRSHGRARSWSEKQRRQNLWTKRGYDLAFRACACLCGGHLRKDLNWDPKDVALPDTQMKKTEDATKKKNRKKHKDLPTLGNKYTFAVTRSKSKAIPNSTKDGRVRTSSASSCLSIDQGYSSSSPSNSEIHGPLGNGFFSPPQSNRSYLNGGGRIVPGYRNPASHNGGIPFPHGPLPQIPDNDILHDFCSGNNLPHAPQFGDPNLSAFSPEQLTPDVLNTIGMLPPQPEMPNPFPPPGPQNDPQVMKMDKMMGNMSLSQRQRCHSWNAFQQQQSPTLNNNNMRFSPSAGTPDTPPQPKLENSRSYPGHSPLSSVLENPNIINPGLPFIGHWNPPTPEHDKPPCHHAHPIGKGDTDSFCQCHSLDKIMEQPLLPFQDFMENATSMLCRDIDLKKPKVIIIPAENMSCGRKKTCTEISITPMCNTTFHKRQDFSAFQNVLQPGRVNPYHIKMEGEGYGSDDFRNSILAKLSRAKCSEMNCVTCGKGLPIYDHFPLIDGTLFLSPIRNLDKSKHELKIDIENKSEYLHAVCVACLDGANNLLCVMCENHWRMPFHQLGSLYMFDVFAAAPCCQSRLCCKRCGVAIVDRRVGLKYYSQYSSKMTCPGCRSDDYHFVHPTSTFRVLGPNNFPYF